LNLLQLYIDLHLRMLVAKMDVVCGPGVLVSTVYLFFYGYFCTVNLC